MMRALVCKEYGPPEKLVIITPTTAGFAEKCVLAEKLCLPLPDGMSYEQGAGFTITYATSYHAFKQSTRLNPGDSLQNMMELTAMVESGKLNPRVTESYLLDQYVDAFKAITERRAKGKVVLTMCQAISRLLAN